MKAILDENDCEGLYSGRTSESIEAMLGQRYRQHSSDDPGQSDQGWVRAKEIRGEPELVELRNDIRYHKTAGSPPAPR